MYVNMTKVGVNPLQLKKHTPPKQVYKKYKTYNTNTDPPEPNSLKK